MQNISLNTFQHAFQFYGNITQTKVKRILHRQNQTLFALKSIDCPNTDILTEKFNPLVLAFQCHNIPGFISPIAYFIENHQQKCGLTIKQSYTIHTIMQHAQESLDCQMQYCQLKGLMMNNTHLNMMLEQLVSTFASLQRIHIAHRDIRPDNILYMNNKYMVTNLKLAVMREDKGTITNDYAGCHMYVSPLQKSSFNSQYTSFQAHNMYKSDVYSLGLVMLQASSNASIVGFNDPADHGQMIYQTLSQMRQQKQYDDKFLQILHLMTQHNEANRPDFMELEFILRHQFNQGRQVPKYHQKVNPKIEPNQRKQQINHQQQPQQQKCATILDLNTKDPPQKQKEPKCQITDNDKKLLKQKQEAKYLKRVEKRSKQIESIIICNTNQTKVETQKINQMIFLSGSDNSKSNEHFLVAYDNGNISVYQTSTFRLISNIKAHDSGVQAIELYVESHQNHHLGQFQNKPQRLVAARSSLSLQQDKNYKAQHFFFSVGKDGQLCIWDYSDVNQLAKVHDLDNLRMGVTCLKYVSYMSILIAATINKTIVFYKILPQQIKCSFINHVLVNNKNPKDSVHSMDVHQVLDPKNKTVKHLLLCGGAEGTITIYDLQKYIMVHPSKKVISQNESNIFLEATQKQGITNVLAIGNENCGLHADRMIFTGGRSQADGAHACLYNFNKQRKVSWLDRDRETKGSKMLAVQHFNLNGGEFETVCFLDSSGMVHFWDIDFDLQSSIQLEEMTEINETAMAMAMHETILVVATAGGQLLKYEIMFQDIAKKEHIQQ